MQRNISKYCQIPSLATLSSQMYNEKILLWLMPLLNGIILKIHEKKYQFGLTPEFKNLS